MEVSAETQKRITDTVWREERERGKVAEKVRNSVKGSGRHIGGAMREKVWIEKVRNLIWLRVSAASFSLCRWR